MGLSDCTVGAVIAVSDMDLAREFYEGRLGLSGGEDTPDGGHRYPCGGGTEIYLYPSPGIPAVPVPHKPAGPSPTSRRWWMN